MKTALKAYNFFSERGAILKTSGEQYLSDFMLFKMSFSDAISINEDERIYTSEYLSNYSSVLGIRVGVPHLTKFDMGGVRLWRGFDIRGCVNTWCVQGVDAPEER